MTNITLGKMNTEHKTLRRYEDMPTLYLICGINGWMNIKLNNSKVQDLFSHLGQYKLGRGRFRLYYTLTLTLSARRAYVLTEFFDYPTSITVLDDWARLL